jgi:hypothetical protein
MWSQGKRKWKDLGIDQFSSAPQKLVEGEEEM